MEHVILYLKGVEYRPVGTMFEKAKNKAVNILVFCSTAPAYAEISATEKVSSVNAIYFNCLKILNDPIIASVQILALTENLKFLSFLCNSIVSHELLSPLQHLVQAEVMETNNRGCWKCKHCIENLLLYPTEVIVNMHLNASKAFYTEPFMLFFERKVLVGLLIHTWRPAICD